MEFSRQEYRSGLPFPTPGDLPNSGTEPGSPVSVELQVNSLPAEPSGKPRINHIWLEIKNMNVMTKGLPRWLRGEEPACQYRRRGRCRFDPCVRKMTKEVWFHV